MTTGTVLSCASAPDTDLWVEAFPRALDSLVLESDDLLSHDLLSDALLSDALLSHALLSDALVSASCKAFTGEKLSSAVDWVPTGNSNSASLGDGLACSSTSENGCFAAFVAGGTCDDVAVAAV